MFRFKERQFDVLVQHLLNEKMLFFPVSEIEIEWKTGHVTTKEAVLRDNLDQGRYILENNPPLC